MRKRTLTHAMIREIRQACPDVGKGQKARVDVGSRTDCTQNDIQVDTYDCSKWGKEIDLSDINEITCLVGTEIEPGFCLDLYVYLPNGWPEETKEDYNLEGNWCARWTGTEWTVDDDYPEPLTPPAHFLPE